MEYLKNLDVKDDSPIFLFILEREWKLTPEASENFSVVEFEFFIAFFQLFNNMKMLLNFPIYHLLTLWSSNFEQL